MIPVPRPPEPEGFDERVRKRGQQWLAANPGKEPRNYWTEFKPHLCEAFRKRCGYAAMVDPTEGNVEHFVPVALRPDLAYEWSNYRFSSAVVNQYKKAAQVLDPFAVGEGWFAILLPSLQLVMTDKVPAEHRELAGFTLRQLHLRDGELIIRQRQQWYTMYRLGHLSLEGLRSVAPLIAEAVVKHGIVAPPISVPRRRRTRSASAGALRLPGVDDADAALPATSKPEPGDPDESP